jgi:hypothetical protein
MRLVRVLGVCGLLSISSAALAQATASAPAVELTARYTDLRGGFSLCPPAGIERQKQTSPSQLVSWVWRDPASKAIVWTLAVQRVADPQNPVGVKTYGPIAIEKLGKAEGFKADYIRNGTLGQNETFEFAGESVISKARFWQRQLWVELKVGQFLVFQINGPPGSKEMLDGVFAAATATVEISDPAKLEQILKANLKAGSEVLAAATADKVKALAGPQALWFLLSFKGKPIGYTMQQAQLMDDKSGLSVETRTVIDLQGHRVLIRRMTVSLDRAGEKWKETFAVDSQPGDVEDGSLENGEVSCKLTSSGARPVANKSKAPPEYLPKALGLLLPRLMPLDKSGAYSFFSYNAARNMFETRTLVIQGNEKITLDGKEVTAVKIVDQSGIEAPPANLYVDKDGNVLRLETSEGLTLEVATEAAVLKAFPKAKDAAKP